MDVETEIRDLRRRMDELEGTVNALTGQLGNIHPDLVALGDASSKRFDLVATTMDRVVARLDTMNTQVWSLRDDMPTLIADAIKLSRKRLS